MSIASQIAPGRSLARRFWVCAIPLVVGAAAFGWSRVAYYFNPVAEVPAIVALGLQDNNKLVLTEMTIRNNGYRPLELSAFRSGCASCVTFGLPSDAGLVDVDNLTVPPLDSVALSVRITVHGTPDVPFRTGITFATNDPHRPEISTVFEAAVRGWIFASPREIDVGTLKPGQTVRRRIEIRDSGRGEPCRFGRLQSPAPDRVKLTLSPTSDASGAEAGQEPVPELIGTLVVDVTAPASPWELTDRITVYEVNKDQPLLTIPIRGKVLPRVQVTPTSIILPRMVHDAADFTVECSLASTAGLALRVAPMDLPPEITATPVIANAGKDHACYRLEWRAESRPARGQSRAVTVRFRAEVDGSAEIITIPVRCRVD